MNKIKYLFSICFVAVLVFCMGISVKAEETEIDTSLFKYSENEDGTIYIYTYTGADETVTIPSEIDGKSVISIGLYECETVKHLIIQEGIMDIRDNAFKSCKNLETISLPSTLKTIGHRAFIECWKLNNVNLPEGLINIGDHAFCNCYSIERLIIPDSVTQIGDAAFEIGGMTTDRIPIYGNPDAYIKTYCDAKNIKFSCINHTNIVTDLAVAPNCTEPGSTEGSHCTICGTYIVKPQRIEPNGKHTWNNGKVIRKPSVTKNGIKEYTCTLCRSTKNEIIAVPKKGNTFTDSNTSYKVTSFSIKERTVEFTTMQKSETNVTIPSTVKIDGITYKVTSIAKNAFKNNKNLKKITINSNITKINANAFNGCTNLKTITIKSKILKSVGKNAFKGISPKAKIKVPSGSLDKYKKMLTKKGQKSSVKITK